ncbi:MAG: allantoate amidohydrolase [Gammaproteobacteria bacterium]
MIPLASLNTASVAEFVSALGGIFEHSPWVAERAAAVRPFASKLHLQEAMCGVVSRASPDEQLALIRAHPELAGRAAIRGELTAESAGEQKRAGLANCSPDEFARLQWLNSAYSKKFGWPFILAVKGHNPASVIAALEWRMSQGAEDERVTSLDQIGRIAGFRLAEAVEEPIGAEVLAMCDRLARFSEMEGGLTCSYLSAAHRSTAALIREWMLAAGLETSIDAVGNVVGRLPAEDSAARTLITGSHYDTVTNAGKYDGRLGVLLPIVVAARIRRSGVRLPYSLEIIAFAEEEGVRFKSTFLGSRAVVGRFDPAALDLVDGAGVSMRAAMLDAGLDPSLIPTTARVASEVSGFIEVHIEQGPVLLSENLALGVVTSIAGSTRAIVTVEGLAGHAGTVPMNLRRDAAAAAAEIVLAVEKRCSSVSGLVGTVGRLNVPDGAVNVIPGRCELSIDVRAPDDPARNWAFDDIVAECAKIATRRNVTIDVRKVLEANCVPCSKGFQARVAESVRRATGATDVRYLPSGAGHDAMMLASLTEVGMLFVRCGNGGISHHPAESLSQGDTELAGIAFADFLMNHAG